MRRLSLVASFAAVLAPTSARADTAIALGLKWLPVSYTSPISAQGGAMGPTPTPLSGWQTTSLNNYFGAFFLDGRLGPIVSLDLGWSSAKREGTAALASDMSFTQFGFSIGAKYHILAPKKERVTPYVYVDFYKYFASLSTSDRSVTNDQASYIAGLASPLGADVAVGAEYFFTTGFSIGAEVLGVKYAYSQGEFTPAGGTKIEAKNQYVTFYTGISLNYRFEIVGSVRVKESGSDEEPKVKPRGKKRAPPPPPPEPEDESGDDKNVAPEEKSDEKPKEKPPTETENVD